jgi:hypothetical protein
MLFTGCVKSPWSPATSNRARLVLVARMKTQMQCIEPSESKGWRPVQLFVQNFDLEATYQLRKEFANLHLRKQMTDAMVQAGSEGEVRCLWPIQIQLFRPGEYLWITIAGALKDE